MILPQTRQHYLANGSEGNHAFDTEDLDGNGRFDDFNSYLQIDLDLADSTFVAIDVNPLYRDDPSGGAETPFLRVAAVPHRSESNPAA